MLYTLNTHTNTLIMPYVIANDIILMKVNGLTAVSSQESCIPATNPACDAMAPFIRSCDRTSTDWLCVKFETENNDISTPGTIILMTGKILYHNGNHSTGTIKMFKQVTCQYSGRRGTDTDSSTTDSIVRSLRSTVSPGESSPSLLATHHSKSPLTSQRFNTVLSSLMGVKYSNPGN